MARTDKNFNEAVESVLNSGGHNEAIKFLIGHDRSREEAEVYLNETLGNVDDSDSMASDGVNKTLVVSSIQSEEENNKALERIEELMHDDPEPESKESKELNELVERVQKFESVAYPREDKGFFARIFGKP